MPGEYRVSRRFDGLVEVRRRSDGAAGVYDHHTVYRFGDLRLSTFTLRVLFAHNNINRAPNN
jgi:hypothetical protein